jgi:hypothetical protein
MPRRMATRLQRGSRIPLDSSGASSGQLDVVVEFPFLPSFPAPGSDERLYLADSVAFVVEIKSNLAKQWDQAQASAAKVRALRRQWRGHVSIRQGATIEQVPPSMSRIPFVAVGFEGDTTVEALAERMARTPEQERPDVALVIDSEAYVGWLGVRETGARSLFSLAMDASYFARNVLTAEIDLRAYSFS